MNLKEYLQQEEFVVKCECGISLMNAKLQIINAELGMRLGRKVIHSMSSRIKSYESIAVKLKQKGLPERAQAVEEYIYDVVGYAQFVLIQMICTKLRRCSVPRKT